VQREIFEREVTAAIRYCEMAMEAGASESEAEKLLRLARARLGSAVTATRLVAGQ